MDEAAGPGAIDLIGGRGVGQVERQQRLESAPGGQRRQDTLPIGLGQRGGGDRRLADSASRWRGRSAAAVNPTTALSAAPSRRCTCQSSGRWMRKRAHARAADAARPTAAQQIERVAHAEPGDLAGDVRKAAMTRAGREVQVQPGNVAWARIGSESAPPGCDRPCHRRRTAGRRRRCSPDPYRNRRPWGSTRRARRCWLPADSISSRASGRLVNAPL